eukprot:maker-scaffold1159_size58420-snap-gene-0.17 protein:Tk06248 transcript:maker-scaffold1159_size58420-snap-gene-0.17-mRNA-1 annotation:"protein osteopotentia"
MKRRKKTSCGRPRVLPPSGALMVVLLVGGYCGLASGLMDSELNYEASTRMPSSPDVASNWPGVPPQCSNARGSWFSRRLSPILLTKPRSLYFDDDIGRSDPSMTTIAPSVETKVNDISTTGTHTFNPPPAPHPQENDEVYVVKAIPREHLQAQNVLPHREAFLPEAKGDEEIKSSIWAEERPVDLPPVNVAMESEALGSQVDSDNGEELRNQTEAQDDDGDGNNKESISNKTEPDIPSFSEWAQKALEEEEKKREEEKRKKVEEKEKMKQKQQQNGQHSPNDSPAPQTPATAIKALKKNFASLDCGAKVVGTNAESQGGGNLISTSRDEYMLNTCTDSAWFVVELCESIKGLKVEIANFELYSSVPRDIRVWLSATYPAREKDWVLFGQFEAEDERSVQTFNSPEGVFGKFVKVEVLSNHGTEHYCPLSLFRIYGISEIELIGRDEDDDEDDEDQQEADDEPGNEQRSKDIVSFIKEKVDETIERVVGVFRSKDQFKRMDMALNESSLIGNSFMYDVVCPNCEEERYRDVYYLLSTKYRMLKNTLAIPALSNSLKNWACKENGVTLAGTAMEPICMEYTLMDFYRTLFGSSRTIALCNVLLIEQGLGLPSRKHNADSSMPSTGGAKTNWTGANSTLPQDPFPKVDGFVNPDEGSSGVAPIEGSLGSESNHALDNANHPPEGSPLDSSTGSFSQPEARESPESVEEVGPVSSEETNGSTDSSKALDEHPSSEDQRGRPRDERSGHEPLETPSPSARGPTPPTSAPKTGNFDQIDLTDPPHVVHVSPTKDGHITKTTLNKPTLVGNGPTSQQQKESVWQKLTNKIKTLERNVTLSSGYLEELSVRYKKQIEDLQIAVRQSSDALAIANAASATDRAQLHALQASVRELTITLENITTQMETIGIWGLGFHLLFLLIEIMVGIILYSCIWRGVAAGKRRRQSVSFKKPKALQSVADSVHCSVKPREPRLDMAQPMSQPVPSERKLQLLVEENTAWNRGRRRKSLDLIQLPNGMPSRRQKKKILRRLHKVSSASRVQDIYDEDDEAMAYHTFHPGDRHRTHSDDYHRNQWRIKDADSSPDTRSSSRPMPRFKVKRVSPESQIPVGPLPTIEVHNKFGVLDSSVHDDPSPMKQRSLLYHYRHHNGHDPILMAIQGDGNEYKDPNRSRNPNKSTLGPKGSPYYRSKSTSPLRIGQSAKQKAIFKNFNPDKADWISTKKGMPP